MPQKLIDFLRLYRVFNVMMVVIAQLLVAQSMLYHPYHMPYYSSALIGIVISALILAAGYLQNNILDYNLDLLGKKKENYWLQNHFVFLKKIVFVLYTLSIVLSIIFYLSLSKLTVLLIPVVSIILLIGYNYYTKKLILIGNLSIAVLCTLSIVFIYSIFPMSMEKISVQNPLLIFIFFFTLYRELIKDLEDRVVDESFGYRTLAIYLGDRLSFYWLLIFQLFFGVFLVYQNYLWQIVLVVIIFQAVSLYYIFQKKYNIASFTIKILFVLGILYLGWNVSQ